MTESRHRELPDGTVIACHGAVTVTTDGDVSAPEAYWEECGREYAQGLDEDEEFIDACMSAPSAEVALAVAIDADFRRWYEERFGAPLTG